MPRAPLFWSGDLTEEEIRRILRERDAEERAPLIERIVAEAPFRRSGDTSHLMMLRPTSRLSAATSGRRRFGRSGSGDFMSGDTRSLLTPLQRRVLDAFFRVPLFRGFVLTGDTALAAFHLFFTEPAKTKTLA